MAMTAQPTRLDRRKARTRRALIDAARRILADKGTTQVSIQEITDEADVGFGSFYNHFESKEELFGVAVVEVLEALGEAVDAACASLDDPAEIYAVGVRVTCRIAHTRPAVAQVLLQTGFSYLSENQGLAARALRDIERGVESGRFEVRNPEAALATTAGSVLSHVAMSLQNRDIDDRDADDLAELLLRMLGLSARSAQAVAHRPLPAVDLG
jgi:AcrR family transcriptional regulator